MFRDERTFVDLCLEGEVLAEEIDDFVDMWHEGSSGQTIYAFLGLTREEYGLWVEKPSSIYFILEARKRGRHLSDYRRGSDFRIAARAASAEDVEDLLEWLRKPGGIGHDAGGESGPEAPSS